MVKERCGSCDQMVFPRGVSYDSDDRNCICPLCNAPLRNTGAGLPLMYKCAAAALGAFLIGIYVIGPAATYMIGN